MADGRVLRGARNHAAIVDALYHLVREGNVQPTMEEVAVRAGVGTRTVFRQFEDVESLYRSMGERVRGELMTLVSFSPPTGDVREDLRALVDRRARVFEHLAPFRRAGRIVRHQSAFLKEQDAAMAKMLRTALEMVAGPHLGRGAEDTLEALDALLSFETWDRLRDRQQLSEARARRVLLHAATALCVQAGP